MFSNLIIALAPTGPQTEQTKFAFLGKVAAEIGTSHGQCRVRQGRGGEGAARVWLGRGE